MTILLDIGKSTMFDVNKEYKKNPDLKKDDVEHIKEWISKQPHLPNITGITYVCFFFDVFINRFK